MRRMIDEKLYGLKQQEAWITPTLVNGYVQSATNPLVYRKNQFGVVEFKGSITEGNTGGLTTLVLPIGYRPSGWETYIVNDSFGAIRVTIAPDGDFTILEKTSGSAVYMSQLTVHTD